MHMAHMALLALAVLHVAWGPSCHAEGMELELTFGMVWLSVLLASPAPMPVLVLFSAPSCSSGLHHTTIPHTCNHAQLLGRGAPCNTVCFVNSRGRGGKQATAPWFHSVLCGEYASMYARGSRYMHRYSPS